MDTLNPWLLALAALLVGALVGGIVVLLMERRSRGGSEDVRRVRGELDSYRQEVAAHYAETARRVNELTLAYKNVYDHLEDGAYRLVGEEELRRRLDAGAPSVTLEGIGQRSLHRPVDDAEPRPVAHDAGDAARDPAPAPADPAPVEEARPSAEAPGPAAYPRPEPAAAADGAAEPAPEEARRG